MNDVKKKRFLDIDDEKVEALIGTLLRVGVITSAVVVFFGAVVFFAQHHNTLIGFQTFTGEPEGLSNVFAIIANAFQFNGLAIIQFGILLLIATPIARVFFSLGAFFIEGDRLYVGITLVVLCILMYSLSGGY
ncbi:MAG: DUF1634 domain-containing protein [Bacteroidota bacterium]|jgi:uncharacterized membrane protein